MKTLLTFTIFASAAFGCAGKQAPKDEKWKGREAGKNAEEVFRQVANFPVIKDTAEFINDLRQTFDLYVHPSPVQKKEEQITAFKKVKLYGSGNDYFLIEYDWKEGSMAEFPWKYQLLLTTGGKLIKTLSGLRFDLIPVFPDQNPYLLLLIATAKGNGGHELYKISADTLENVYEGYFDYGVRTYDAHHDNKIYEPNELALRVKDFNKDGCNDIFFKGKIVLIRGQTKYGDWFDGETKNGKTVYYSEDNPFRKIPVEFIFLYDKESGNFKAQENYTEKYGIYD